MQSPSNHDATSSLSSRSPLKHEPLLSVLGLLTITVLWFTINLPSLITYPAPYSDESQIGGMSAQYLQSGGFHTTIYGEKSIEVYKNWRLYTVGLAGVFRIWGIGLAQARIFSWVGVLVGGWLLFSLGYKLYGAQVGLLSATLYLFSLRTLWVSHVVRPDAWVNAASIAIFLLFWLTKESRNRWLAFILGIFLAVAVDIYIVAIYSSIAIALAMLIEFRQRFDWVILRYFIIGGLIGIIYWLAFQLFPNPVDMIAGWQGHLSAIGVGGNSLASMISNMPSSIIALIKVGVIGHSRLGMIEAIYILGGLIILAIRRRETDKFLLIGWVVLGIGQVVPYKGLWHLVDLLPLFSITVATGAESIGGWLAARFQQTIFFSRHYAFLIAGVLIAGFIFGGVSINNRNRLLNYEQYVGELRQLVPPNSSILGEGTWWWGFQHFQFTAEEYLRSNNMRGEIPDSDIIRAVITERRVNVILIDEYLSFHPTPFEPDLYDALVTYTTLNCRLEGVVELYGYGVEYGGPAIKRTQVFICPTPQ